MTFHPAYWDEPDKTTFESKVTDIDGDWVVLEKTYFHPEGGGQPADRGTIEGFEVTDVQVRGDSIAHRVPGYGLKLGEEVTCEIDEEFRRYCMRCHTGSHVVYGAARQLFDSIDYSGFQIDQDKARIDFRTAADVDRDTLLELERKCNMAILGSRPIHSHVVEREKADNMEDLAFAKEMPEEEKVRIVEIEGWDKATCSGTHLDDTIHVGRIHVLDKKKLQEGVTRIYFSVGKKALEDDMEEKENLLEATKRLETNPVDLPGEIDGLVERNGELSGRIEELNQGLLKKAMDDLTLHGGDGYDLLYGSVSTGNTDLLSNMVKDRTGPENIVFVVNEEGTLSAVVSVGEDVDHSAVEIIDSLGQRFGGGGGGTDDFAQGGGFDADAEALVQHVRELLS